MSSSDDINQFLDQMQRSGFHKRVERARERAMKNKALEAELNKNPVGAATFFVRVMVKLGRIMYTDKLVAIVQFTDSTSVVYPSSENKPMIAPVSFDDLQRLMPSFGDVYPDAEIVHIDAVKQTMFDSESAGTLYYLQIELADGNIRLNILPDTEIVLNKWLEDVAFVDRGEMVDLKVTRPGQDDKSRQDRNNTRGDRPNRSRKHGRPPRHHATPAAAAVGDDTESCLFSKDITDEIESGVDKLDLDESDSEFVDSKKQDLPPPDSVTPSTNDKTTCVICMEFEKTIIVLPCAHKCLCAKCAHEQILSECPLCRRKIKKLSRVFE